MITATNKTPPIISPAGFFPSISPESVADVTESPTGKFKLSFVGLVIVSSGYLLTECKLCCDPLMLCLWWGCMLSSVWVVTESDIVLVVMSVSLVCEEIVMLSLSNLGPVVPGYK